MKSKSGLSSLVAFLIIASFGFIMVLTIIKLGKLDVVEDMPSQQINSDRRIESLQKQSTSDAPTDIQKDLDDTDLDSLDTDLDQAASESKDL